MIIGLLGEKLAGKDTAAKYLSEKYGADHFRFTHILDEILEDLNLPVSRENEINLGLSLRKIFGEHVLVNALEKRARKSWAKLLVINGIRMDELDIVKGWEKDVKIIYITAPLETRFQRYQNRREKADDAQMDFNKFKEQEGGPTEARIPELGKQADLKIENTGSLDEFHQQLDSLMAQLNVKPTQ